MTYLQRAGGSAAGIFSGLRARGDDANVWVAGHDDDPVFVGEYTHTGYFTPKNHGDDKLVWVGEYTHMGGLTSAQIDAAVKDVLMPRLLQMTTAQLDALYRGTNADRNKVAAGTGLGPHQNEIKKAILKAGIQIKKSSDGSGSSGGGGGGLFGSGLSPTLVVGGIAVIGVLGFAATQMTGGAARSNPGRRRRRRRRNRRR